MNKKITLQDIIESLMQKHSMERKDAEAFVKGIFELIEDTLSTEKLVKIKGLGTFKLIDVDSRESINVNSGERFKIEGHSKISFIPDATLKNIINKPFSHFETVILNESTNLENTDVVIENPSAVTSDESSEDIQTNTFAAENIADQTVNEEPAVETETEQATTDAEATVTEPVVAESETEAEVPVETSVTEEVVAQEVIPEETAETEIETAVPEEETTAIEERAEEAEKEVVVTEEEITSDETPAVEETSEDDNETELTTAAIAAASEEIADAKEEEEESFIEPTPNVDATEETIAADEPTEKTADKEEEKEEEAQSISEAAPTINEKYQNAERINIEPAKPEKEEKDGNKQNIILYIVIAVIILFACFLFFMLNDNSSTKQQPEKKPVTVTDTVKAVTDTAVAAMIETADTVSNEIVQEAKAETKEPEVKKGVEIKKEAEKSTAEPKAQSSKPEAKEETNNTSATKVYDETLQYRISGTKATHTIQEGEGLMRISLQYYGTKKLYTYIMDYNKSTIGENGDKIRMGMKIKIPELKPIK